MNRLILIVFSFQIILVSCVIEEESDVAENGIDLPVSFFQDSSLLNKKMMATIKVLAVDKDSIHIEFDGVKSTRPRSYFTDTRVPEMRWDPISISFPSTMTMSQVNQVFEGLTSAKQYDLALAVRYQNDSAKIGYTISRSDIPMNCCFEHRNQDREIIVLSNEILKIPNPEIEIRNVLDSFFLKDLVEIDSLYLNQHYLWVTSLSVAHDSCLGYECASLYQQEKYNWVSDSANFQLLGKHYRPTSHTLVDLQLGEESTYQDFISLVSAHHRWLAEKRNSLSMLYFNMTFIELKRQAKKDRSFQEYIFVIRMMAPYRLRYLD